MFPPRDQGRTMLLRRISKHVTDQNWFAVGIDFLIVVVGVFIGIQVNDWNAQRIEQSLEQEYLSRLADNLEESSDNTKRTNRRWIRRVGYLNLALKNLNECALADKDKSNFAEGMYHIGKFEMSYLNDSTLEEMKSTGRSGIIRNRAIHDVLDVVEREASYQERVEPQIIAHISPHLAYVKQRVSFEITSISDYNNTSDDDFEYSNIASYDFDMLCSDAKFIASVSSIRATVIDILEWNDRVAKNMDNALDLIRNELDN